jgi:hypothetical protein
MKYKQESNTIRVNLWQSPISVKCNHQLQSFSVGLAADLTEIVQTCAIVEINASSKIDITFLFMEAAIIWQSYMSRYL